MSKEYIQEICDNHEVDVAFINITATQLKKSIIDATVPVRELLAKHGMHDYATQGQGTNDKVTLDVFYLESEVGTQDKVTLYKPNSKKGDPRIWFTNIKRHVEAGDVLAIIPNENLTGLYAFNVTDQEGFNGYMSDRSARMASKVGV